MRGVALMVCAAATILFGAAQLSPALSQETQLAQTKPQLRTPPPPPRNPNPRNQPGAQHNPQAPSTSDPGLSDPSLPEPSISSDVLLQGLPAPPDEDPLTGQAGRPAGGQIVPGQLLVVVADATPAELAADYGLSDAESFTLASLGATAFIANVPAGQDELVLLDLMALDPRVALVQFNFVYQAQEVWAAAASSPLSLQGRGVVTQQAGAGGVLVGIVDTGIDRAHPALQGRSIELIDVVGDGDPASLKGAHGTALAGIIAGGDQLAGPAPAARLLGLRAFSVTPDEASAGRSSSHLVAQAIDLASQRGVQVLNLSFAGPRDPIVALLLQIAAARGMLIVAAAGNQGPEAPPAYPAALDEVVAATATDSSDRLLEQANRGTYVSLAALGVGLLVAQPDGRYGIKDGTSLAAAQVSGLAAAILAETPGLSAAQLRVLLEETAVDLGAPGHDPDFGAGRIDTAAARAAAKAVAKLEDG